MKAKKNKRFRTIILLFGLLLIIGCENHESNINIVPEPEQIQINGGQFEIVPNTAIIVESSDPTLIDVAEYFIKRFNTASGLELSVVSEAETSPGNISIKFSDSELDESLGKEGYSLSCSEYGIILKGTAHGLFYGVQTLFQLLPHEIYASAPAVKKAWIVPSVKIIDKPRFQWRGMHLDVGRHMFPVSFIKKYIDYIAMHKMNTFHWHLTEDQGWRIEIKEYPKLTEIGAWRRGTQIGKTKESNNIRYGGYYTQQEIKDIVKYAAERFITVVPEIEMPGHSVAALASYPQLSCTGGPFDVRTLWGIDDNIYCAGNDSVFAFLENVLAEVLELFPSKYIHIGGDEAPKKRWENCKKCQLRIKEEGLKDEHELQSYFIRRIEKYLNSKGRQIIGWDEILEGGLAPNAAVMSWRGIDGGIEAAKQNHNVVMTPTDYCYFDYYQAPPENEPIAIGGYLTLEKVYSYEPVPDELSTNEAKYIMGVQANQWTEYIETPNLAEYMTLPRLCALSEVAWSPKEKRDYDDFTNRMSAHYQRLDILGVNYHWPALIGLKSKNVFIKESNMRLISQLKNSEIRYTIDESEPTQQSKLYSNPINISESALVKLREFTQSGKGSPVYLAEYIKENPINPIPNDSHKSELNFEYFVITDPINSVSQLKYLKPDSVGLINKIEFPYDENKLSEMFGLIFNGYIEIPQDDVYTFFLNSNDGSQLYISNKLVVDNDGEHGEYEKDGQIALKEGLHKIELLYFQAGGEKALDLFIQKDKTKEELELL